ncbi:kinase D-interacting substrate of 220 kDa isoform X3 [Bacillus rossius redtenbacheri]|uniref:kinase D-interacting substrate of 220 kDa isoform X3 n=1 Tax=Bacillus rossius redtenbacheri TaxID=93214 RepID=UPI002FDEECE8
MAELSPLLARTPPRAYGGVLTYYSFLRRGAQTLHRTESMASLCFRPLVGYVLDDNLAGLQGFLEGRKLQLDDRDENGTTALIVAASKGKLPFVREFINHGADVNAEDGDGWTALLCAAKQGYSDVCLELLEHGAEIDHRDMGGWTALMWTAYKGHSDTAQLLLQRGAEVNAHGNYHISSLLWAAGRSHAAIVKELIRYGAKVNVGDKYGTTALVWASRKGNAEIVESLIKAGANVDTAGMFSWTALLVATMGGHSDVVGLLLEQRPNVNALDKDGCTALTIACKDGFHEIAVALLNSGAYINIQDRAGDTNLIHAVKGGHRSVVEALLKKYADVDVPGKERKTAVYWAVEKGNVAILKFLLTANPDLEIATKDGDTPLLRAVRIRNVEMVQLLLDKKARVSVADKKGDTALHIAMRARSKAIVEVLLRNPKHSQHLYRPNKAGETPYHIDMNHQKTILGQIFGARRLNTNEDNENMLGYDLYSSALADILSEPSLSMPITVGLYAKWGSGKSFLLNKLREEMKGFAHQWLEPLLQLSSTLVFGVVSLGALVLGVAVSLATRNWVPGVATAGGAVLLSYLFLFFVWHGSQRYDWSWPYNFHLHLTRRMNALKLVLQVTFCHPPGATWNDAMSAQPIRFLFTDHTRVSSTTGGENSLVQMLGSLYDAIEKECGAVSTRLYRAFRPRAIKSASSWRWRRMCCVPYAVVFALGLSCVLVGACVLTLYLADLDVYKSQAESTAHPPVSPPSQAGAGNTSASSQASAPDTQGYGSGRSDRKDAIGPPGSRAPALDRTTAHIVLVTVGAALATAVVANAYTWARVLQALLFSQRSHLRRAIARLDTLKSEGFLQSLRQEVALMTDMVKCLGSFTSQQTRLVVVVDGLDSCEQDKVLLVLDAVHMLFSDSTAPFIIVLAIDPHIISKAVETNSRRLFSESNIGGHDYLRNMVHLPFYLQNSGLRNVSVAQRTARHHRKSSAWNDEEGAGAVPSGTLSSMGAGRRLSSESAVMNSSEKLKPPPPRKGSRKMKLSESIASSLGSNLNRAGGPHDLTRMLLTDDYFSDVNPRSMRRLMNVVYITGRLLKAFDVDFNWYHLASWVNITEQWPYRTSWIILHYDACEDSCDDGMSLKAIYDRLRPMIPVSKEVEPLLELDRDEKKFDIFLTFHRSSLLVSDLKIFLPFTINLDPYIKKVIKEEFQNAEESLGMQMAAPPSAAPVTSMPAPWPQQQKPSLLRRQRPLMRSSTVQGPSVQYHPHGSSLLGWQPWMSMQEPAPRPSVYPQPSFAAQLPPGVLDQRLSSLTVDDVCDLLDKLEDLHGPRVAQYARAVRDNNISGRVLLFCDLGELKDVLQMGFGDWELFRVLVVSLREQEMAQPDDPALKNVRFSVPSLHGQPPPPERKGSVSKLGNVQPDKDKLLPRSESRASSKQTVMEKQVTLEEQMICGALQTLNEEACEDVLGEAGDAALLSGLRPPDGEPDCGAHGCEDTQREDSPVHQTGADTDKAQRHGELQRAGSCRSVCTSRQLQVLAADEPCYCFGRSAARRSHSDEGRARARRSSSSLDEGSPPRSPGSKRPRVSLSLSERDGEDSDDESTPLVSEASAPSTGPYGALPGEFFNRGFAVSSGFGSDTASSADSPSSVTTPVSPVDNGNDSSRDVCADRNLSSSHGSSVSLSQLLEPTGNYYHLVVAGGNTQEQVSGGNSRRSSGSLPRQDALDSLREPNENPETTV